MEKKGFNFNKLIGFNVFTITLVLIVFLGGVGLTYAYYAFSYEEESVIAGNVINVDLDLEVDLVVGTNEEMVPLQDAALSNALNAVGSTNGACVDQYNNLSCQVYKITVINKGSRVKHLKGTIELYAKEGTGNAYSNLKWRELKSPTTLKSDTLVNGMEKSTLVSRLTMNSKETKEWYIAVWISEIDDDQRETDKGIFGGTVTFEVVEPTFDTGNVIIDSIMGPEAETDSFIDFSQTSEASNTNGVYIRNGTYDNEYPIYYYRGDVNNNLIFADTCWKIVRTTETGGVKLIYNGVPTNGQCNNTGSATTIGHMPFNENYNSPAYVGYMYGTSYLADYENMSSTTYVYGNSVTYSNGTYTLTNTISKNWSEVYETGLTNHHYTCFTTGTTCSSVSYIYHTNSLQAYYLTLTGGKNIETALTEILDNNTTSSTIKDTIDSWYFTNIEQKGYSSYVEDTIWCNDRSIYSLGGFNPNGGSTYLDGEDGGKGSHLTFSSYEKFMSETTTPNLTCSRNADKFTRDEVNGNGALDYSVGLLTADEILLAGAVTQGSENTNYYLNNEDYYWSGSPFCFRGNRAYEVRVDRDGKLSSLYVYNNGGGVRPSVSLKPGFSLTGDGDGTEENPYVLS